MDRPWESWLRAAASRSGWWFAVAAPAQEFGNQREKGEQRTEEHD